MGVSKFMSRKQLLALKKGWKSNPVDDFKQQLYDKGHLHEDEAREILELEFCEDFPPVVGLLEVDGIAMLASFDGLEGGVPGAIHWEHKDWNVILSENVLNSVLEPLHYWQLEHQCIVNGADSCLFTCSDGTEDKRVSMTYDSLPERRAEVIAGWKQFLIDLDAFVIEAKTEVVVAKVQEAFPIIECHVEGSMVISNLGDYIPLIKTLADEQMSIILDTDQDFADKDAFNKNVKKGRESLKLKASDIETQFESLAEFNGFVKQADKILQKLFSHGEKQVKESKEAKKRSIMIGADAEVIKYANASSKTINGVILDGVMPNWPAIIKGKRSFEKMQDAVDAEIAKTKIEINEQALIIRKNLDSLTELAGKHKFLFSDHAELMLKGNDDLVNLIKQRISDHEESEENRLEDEREEMRIEEEEKATKKAELKVKGDSRIVAWKSTLEEALGSDDINYLNELSEFISRSNCDETIFVDNFEEAFEIYNSCYGQIHERRKYIVKQAEEKELEEAKKVVSPELVEKVEKMSDKPNVVDQLICDGKPVDLAVKSDSPNAVTVDSGPDLLGADMASEPDKTVYAEIDVDGSISELPLPHDLLHEVSAWAIKRRVSMKAVVELEGILKKYFNPTAE